MSKASALILGGSFYALFLLLTPLGAFNDWVPPHWHTGYYSVTAIDAGDDTGYTAYLRSLFFDGDLDFVNERNYAHAEKFTPTGYVFNNWQMGQAVFFFPFFLAGHGLAQALAGLGVPVSVDGYSAPYYLSTAVASGFWLAAGLGVLFFLLRTWERPRTALWASITLWLGSPLLYFSFIRQRMAHTVEFFCAALFVFAWIRLRRSSLWMDHAVLGVVLGLLCMVRILNVTFLALYLVDLVVVLREERVAGKIRSFAVRAAAFAAGWWTVMLPQLLAWQRLNGSPWPLRHVHFAGRGLEEVSLLPLLERLAGLFTDPQWGLLYSMPLALAGGVGLGIKRSGLRGLRPGLAAYLGGLGFVLCVYPEDAASYGPRHLISALPVFALGWGALIGAVSRFRWGWWAVVGVSGAAVGAQYGMIVQYKVLLPYNHPQFSWEALAALPGLVTDRPEVWLRSTNFFRLLLAAGAASWDFRDVLFLIAFPLAQGISLWALLAGFRRWAPADPGREFRLRPKHILISSAAAVAGLLVLVAWGAPGKSPDEIQARRIYKQRITEGDSLLRQGQVQKARARFIQASELMPPLWGPYFKIGATWNLEGDWEKANVFYEKGLARNPTHGPALLSLGDNLKRLGRLAEAEKRLKQARRAWPYDRRVYDALAQVYAQGGRWKDAVGLLHTALQLDPFYGPGHVNLAVLYTIMKQPRLAAAHLNQAVDLGVRGPAVDRLAALYRSPAP